MMLMEIDRTGELSSGSRRLREKSMFNRIENEFCAIVQIHFRQHVCLVGTDGFWADCKFLGNIGPTPTQYQQIKNLHFTIR